MLSQVVKGANGGVGEDKGCGRGGGVKETREGEGRVRRRGWEGKGG